MSARPATRILAWYFRRHARRRNRGPGRRAAPGEVRRVLLVSSTGLGDTVLSTPAIAAAREAWPEAELHLLVKGAWAGLFSACPHLDGVTIYPGKFKRVGPLLRELRSIRPDLALILHGNDPDIVPLAYLSGRPYLVCRASVRFDFLLDQGVYFDDPDRHIAERRLDVVRAVAGPLDSRSPEIFVPPRMRDWAAVFRADLGLASGERMLVLNPGGSRQPKQWPDHHWRDLNARLGRVRGLRPVLFGSPAERPRLEALAHGAGRPDLPVVARRDLLETAALLESAEGLVGPDSGLAHLAMALGVKAAVMFGPDNPVLSGPYRPRAAAAVLIADRTVCPDLADCHRKICRPNRCLEAVRPEAVLEALREKLEIPLDFRGKIK